MLQSWPYQTMIRLVNIKSGWWFGTFFIFLHIGNNHPNWLIFFSEGLKPPTRNGFRNEEISNFTSWAALVPGEHGSRRGWKVGQPQVFPRPSGGWWNHGDLEDPLMENMGLWHDFKEQITMKHGLSFEPWDSFQGSTQHGHLGVWTWVYPPKWQF